MPSYNKLDEFPPRRSCGFCKMRKVDELELGEIASLSEVLVHYYCLLLSNKVVQRGRDDQGILGFMPRDIKKEIDRGKKLKCAYCKKNGATIECANKKCKIKFHLPCGTKRGSIHHFFKKFESFCASHRPRQKVSPRAWEGRFVSCVVCSDRVDRGSKVIWPICCKPSSTLIHRRCLQKMAVSHGYCFKCPLCNDTVTFTDEAKRMGIYVPEREPSWELEEGAFQDQLDRTISCQEGTRCLCDNGPAFSRIGTKWKLERCYSCGGNGIHLACSSKWIPGNGFNMLWNCETCSLLSAPPVAPSPTRIVSDDEGMEIDVVSIEPESRLRIQSTDQLYPTHHLPPANRPPALNPIVLIQKLDNVPIIIGDSDDEFSIVEISSTESSPPPKPLLRSASRHLKRRWLLAPKLESTEVVEIDDTD